MDTMRRSDRAIEPEETFELLEKGEFGVLSTVGDDRQPYGVPVNYHSTETCIYFHSAIEGRKITNITSNPNVSFCVVGKTQVLPKEFGTRYESVIVTGHVMEVFDDEKQGALEGLLRKYSRDYFESGLKYISAQRETVRVFKITIDSIAGKSRR